MKRILLVVLALLALASAVTADELEKSFVSPPPGARPWVFWFWINGNISKEGITADLEAFKRVGIGGVIWMEVSGPWWAPEGKVVALSPQWHECMQWAVRECDRLGIEFDMSVDFGYGSGGPHITPELSMQKLYWSETEVEGGRKVSIVLPKPEIAKNLSAWLRPGAEINTKVREYVEKFDSYKDVAVVAISVPSSPAARAFRIPEINLKNGTDWRLPRSGNAASTLPPDFATPSELVVDLTSRMTPDGRLAWDAPSGKWLILRYGHASNFKMTRPCPQVAVGLECDRLAKAGIEAHYGAFLKKIFEGVGPAAGKALTYVHIDSWEAGGQNWTASFPAEFRLRRGYDLRPWLPVLTGRVVGSVELSERFLWDVRMTVSEMIHDNYAGRLRELAQTHGMKLSIEAYGWLCIDNLAYAGISDMPMSEFWAMGNGVLPTHGGYELSSKAMASAAHIYGKPIAGAESFTSGRGWQDHPYLLKAMGDKAFCRGVNRMVFHCSAHQAYESMIPGLTHRKWGEQFQRYNTWWNYSRPWMDYLSRCQHLLQQGEFVADVCYWFGEGAPLNVDDMKLEIPKGYDFDFCSSDAVLQMSVKKGRLFLPSGANYRYLRLPDTDRMTLPLARKIRELVEGGACVIGGKRLKGAPGLTDFPRCDVAVEKIAAALWDANRWVSVKTLAEVFARDSLPPDFAGEGLSYIHRRVGEADIYFVSHQENRPFDATCTFRVAGKRPELWDPETGAIHELPKFTEKDGMTTVHLRFEPAQSWFVVFRNKMDDRRRKTEGRTETRVLHELTGSWEVIFDPKWGGPAKVMFEKLEDWSKRPETGIKYYSGTATYRNVFDTSHFKSHTSRLYLDLGKVEVMARVRLNGKNCGISWKPPYLLDITDAVHDGENKLEIDVVNLWINRMIGDEQLPEDSNWKDFETLLEWPDWFKTGKLRPSGRYTFTSCRHYKKDTPLASSGLLGPVTISTFKESR